MGKKKNKGKGKRSKMAAPEANIPMDSSDVLETAILTPPEQAEIKKEEGNKFFKIQKYREAIQCYTEAIGLNPECATYYSNRCACYMGIGSMQLALDDAATATKIDNKFTKAYVRQARCQIAIGDADAASRTVDKIKELEPDNVINDVVDAVKLVRAFETDMTKSYDKQDYRKVMYLCDRGLQHATHCVRFKILKAECLAFMGKYQESQDIVNDILRNDNTNADAMYVRGVCLYYQDQTEKAFTHFQQVLRLFHDHTKAKEIYRKAKALKQKKEAGNESFKAAKFQEAYNLYTEALHIDPQNHVTNSKLYNNRALTCMKLNRLNEAVADCTTALQLDDKYVKAYLRRAKAYQDLDMHEEAVRDYEQVFKLEKTAEHKQFLANAKLELKKSKRKDYYKILGIERNATEDQIKKAYRKRALVHHPDRHANETDDVKREQERKFKEVGEAYGVLTDAKKKARYDSGQDLDESEGYGDIDPNNIFQAFFGGHGGHNFQAHYSGHGGHQQPPHFGGHGFTFQFG